MCPKHCGTIDPKEAFRRAVESLSVGHFDSRTESGAQTNALESIAWSLIAFLSRDSLIDGNDESFREGLDRIGLLDLKEMH